MNVKVKIPSAKGSVRVIPSKSVAHRYLISAALSENGSRIICPATSKDIEATVRCLNSLGADIREKDGVYDVTPVKKKKKKKAELFCGESGSTLRFLVPVASALGGDVTFSGEGRLPARPMGELLTAMTENGALVEYGGTLPLTTRGGMKSGIYKIPGNVSSQFITGLVFALPVLSGDSIIEITGKIESLPYINITLQAVRKFGICAELKENKILIRGNRKYKAPEVLEVEGDWSNAAFWLCLGALSENGVTVRGLSPESLQGDRAIVDILRSFGAEVSENGDSVTVKRRELRGIRLDASEIPDLVPVAAVVAAVSSGETVIYNAERLRIKESDRIESTVAMLKSLGAEAEATEDGIKIIGKPKLSGGRVDSFNDHRIAMSAAVSAAVCEESVTVLGAEAVNKSYGDFFERLEALGAITEREEV